MAKPPDDVVGIPAFIGACLLTAALLLPHAPMLPILAGMVLAWVVRWTWTIYRSGIDASEE